MRIISSGSSSRRGTSLTRLERATNIARSSRNADKLYVTNQAQAHNLVRFTSHAKVLGNGLAVIDFGSRIGNIHTSYLAGENWHREMFIQSSSFLASAGASIGVVKGGLVLLAAFTPVGLVGLIVGGAAIAVGAAGTAVAANHVFEKTAAVGTTTLWSGWQPYDLFDSTRDLFPLHSGWMGSFCSLRTDYSQKAKEKPRNQGQTRTGVRQWLGYFQRRWRHVPPPMAQRTAQTVNALLHCGR